jgi:hypothetical protein
VFRVLLLSLSPVLKTKILSELTPTTLWGKDRLVKKVFAGKSLQNYLILLTIDINRMLID